MSQKLYSANCCHVPRKYPDAIGVATPQRQRRLERRPQQKEIKELNGPVQHESMPVGAKWRRPREVQKFPLGIGNKPLSGSRRHIYAAARAGRPDTVVVFTGSSFPQGVKPHARIHRPTHCASAITHHHYDSFFFFFFSLDVSPPPPRPPVSTGSQLIGLNGSVQPRSGCSGVSGWNTQASGGMSS